MTYGSSITTILIYILIFFILYSGLIGKYKKEEIIYTSSSEKRIFSETINVDVTDVDNIDELLAEEKENVVPCIKIDT